MHPAPATTPAAPAFGKAFSDHMLLARYAQGSWSDYELLPFGNLSLSPAALCLHYGQTIFEGMKAFRRADGRISLFRVADHYRRLCRSADRMCMPHVPEALFTEGLTALVAKDAAWVPEDADGALYLRPFLIATEERFGVGVSEEYLFLVFTGPVAGLYPRPLHVKVEDRYIRAAPGGVGAAKCGGNYGGALYPTQLARAEGFDQVLWTDGSDDLHLEESGTMNVLFRINDVLVTPPLSDTILDGITRDSVLQYARTLGIAVEERRIPAKELVEAHRAGTLQEAFGCGTAAVVAPLASITVRGERLELPPLSEQHFCMRARRYLTDLRRGLLPDPQEWNTIVI
ncbi:branched-chain amino acid aminotransferase [Flaviaesturariibacter amylovorans]|uniref:branched-chain-amino-acid transaminase n=1 Tax=Flaviaesturariibacter amylovorans TaxID=1084520 RepID=A0ABP8H8N9_9BACT